MKRLQLDQAVLIAKTQRTVGVKIHGSEYPVQLRNIPSDDNFVRLLPFALDEDHPSCAPAQRLGRPPVRADHPGHIHVFKLEAG